MALASGRRRRLIHVVLNFSRLDTACACTARLVHGGESRNQDWNYSDQQERRHASKAQLARHTTASSTLKETIMHARVPIAPEKTRPSPTPPSHQGILTTPPGDPHNAPSSGVCPSHIMLPNRASCSPGQSCGRYYTSPESVQAVPSYTFLREGRVKSGTSS